MFRPHGPFSASGRRLARVRGRLLVTAQTWWGQRGPGGGAGTPGLCAGAASAAAGLSGAAASSPRPHAPGLWASRARLWRRRVCSSVCSFPELPRLSWRSPPTGTAGAALSCGASGAGHQRAGQGALQAASGVRGDTVAGPAGKASPAAPTPLGPWAAQVSARGCSRSVSRVSLGAFVWSVVRAHRPSVRRLHSALGIVCAGCGCAGSG